MTTSQPSTRREKLRRSERGQSIIFFGFLLVFLVAFMLVGVEVARITYARGEVGKAADAAALAAASRINVALYRETGQIIFLPDVYDYAQQYASNNSAYLADRSIPVTVTGIYINEVTQTVAVSISADLTALVPGVLAYEKTYSITGTAKAKLDGR